MAAHHSQCFVDNCDLKGGADICPTYMLYFGNGPLSTAKPSSREGDWAFVGATLVRMTGDTPSARVDCSVHGRQFEALLEPWCLSSMIDVEVVKSLQKDVFLYDPPTATVFVGFMGDVLPLVGVINKLFIDIGSYKIQLSGVMVVRRPAVPFIIGWAHIQEHCIDILPDQSSVRFILPYF